MTPDKCRDQTDSDAVRTTVADTVVGHYGVDFTLVFAPGSFVSRAIVAAGLVPADR